MVIKLWLAFTNSFCQSRTESAYEPFSLYFAKEFRRPLRFPRYCLSGIPMGLHLLNRRVCRVELANVAQCRKLNHPSACPHFGPTVLPPQTVPTNPSFSPDRSFGQWIVTSPSYRNLFYEAFRSDWRDGRGSHRLWHQRVCSPVSVSSMHYPGSHQCDPHDLWNVEPNWNWEPKPLAVPQRAGSHWNGLG